MHYNICNISAALLTTFHRIADSDAASRPAKRTATAVTAQPQDPHKVVVEAVKADIPIVRHRARIVLVSWLCVCVSGVSGVCVCVREFVRLSCMLNHVFV